MGLGAWSPGRRRRYKILEKQIWEKQSLEESRLSHLSEKVPEVQVTSKAMKCLISYLPHVGFTLHP